MRLRRTNIDARANEKPSSRSSSHDSDSLQVVRTDNPALTADGKDPALLATAIDRAVQGMDFAGALHLGRAEGCDGFATFDRQFVKAAKAQGVRAVRALDA